MTPTISAPSRSTLSTSLLGSGLSAGKFFRIGHLGDTNDLTILGALAGVEMGLALAGVPHEKGGVQAAMDYLTPERRGGGV